MFMNKKGREEAKKQDLSDVKSTQIDNAMIIQQPFRTTQELKTINKSETIISGNVKAIIPLMRERLKVELDKEGRARYKKESLQML
jgi:hypothetical protein